MKHLLKLSLVSALALSLALPVSAKTATKVAVKAPVAKTTAKKTIKVVKAAPKKTVQVAKTTVKKSVRVAKAAPKKTVQVARVSKPVVRTVSYGRQYGLDGVYDPLSLHASSAVVVDQNSWTTVYEKNARAKLPIASITKLMTAMVTLDAGLDLNENIVIDGEDAAHYRSSRLPVGTNLTRHDVLLLALMSSENRAAYALGRTYPGGIYAFVQAMNAKAAMLNMDATFVDPSGLSSSNQATAMDLAKMVNAASQYRAIRQLSTAESATVYTEAGRKLVYHNSDRLISRNMGWKIGMQKTGTLRAAGKCVVIQAVINGSPKIIVLLDSSNNTTRITDAVAIKDWLEAGGAGTISSLRIISSDG